MASPGELPPVDELEGVEQNEEDVGIATAPATAAPVGLVLEEGAAVDDEIDDEANDEGAVQSSVQIAPTGNADPLAADDDARFIIQLGDRVVIDSTKYGRTIGTVYYRSLERISVKPDGVSNMLHDFEVSEEEDKEVYNEDDGVTGTYVIEKRKFESFVEQQDFRVNQIIDTFNAEGELYHSYKIVKVDKENDYIQIQDLEDEEVINDLNFNFIGIEADEDFKVISIRQLVGPDQNQQNEAQVAPEGEGKEDEEAEEEEQVPPRRIKILGFIEVALPTIFREAAAYEQRIPDNLQKVDALNDFISSLDPVLQKDSKSIRAVRVLVETLFNLKQDTVSYNDDGSIRGPKEISAETLSELIKRVAIPLGRPVLDISKKEYLPTGDDEDTEDADIDATNIYPENFRRELLYMNDKKSTLVSSAVAGAPGGQIVREWADEQSFLQKYLSPWRANSTTEPLWTAISDSEFFRNEPPEYAQAEGETFFLETVPGNLASHDPKNPPVFDEVPFGIERALSTTYRKGADRRKQVLVPEEKATMNSYLLFPIKVANQIGSKRSSSVAIDSGRSQLPTKIMKDILEASGSPTEVGSSSDLLLLDVEGNTLGNIPVADYIEGLSVPALGLGDTFQTLEQYGMDNLELTPAMIGVLSKKIELYQGQLLSAIAALRKIIDSETGKAPEPNPFIEAPTILEEIRSQPTLVDDLEEFERINPALAQSDIGKVAYLMSKHPEYFQVAAGKNSVLIAKALLDSNNAMYLQTLRVANLLKYNELNSGMKPKPNNCRHVADLVSVRKIPDDGERMQKLTEFFKKYQGGRDGNWINCNLCKEHLLCLHERLQIQAYLNPVEKAAIEKEIVLKFSGGAFQGKYICRNCGQGIRDLDFDNSIEFDDDGKPKSGRAVLVDEDALFQERLELMTSIPIEPSERKQLKLNENETKAYNIIREITIRLGILFDNDGYKRVIDKTVSLMNAFPTADKYIEQQKKAKMADWNVAYARNLICAAGVFSLLEIQTRIPSYQARKTVLQCENPGFGGYPLDEDRTNKQGINYIVCAIESVRRIDGVWADTKFHERKDLTAAQRQQGIMVFMERILKSVISDDIIQAGLAAKRKYLEKQAEQGAPTGPKDEIPATFLPEQIIITPEDAAKEAITPEVAENMGNRGKLSLVKLWIRQAHLLAKKTASLTVGSPLSETTCCLANIEVPGTFWRSATDMPDIGKRVLTPYRAGQNLMTEFLPREVGGDVAEPDKELYYRIFLKCCFQGPKIGYPHEPNLLNMCVNCGFQFPTIPAVMDSSTEGKSALSSQNVVTGTAEFTTLLDTIHNVNKVAPIPMPELQNIREIMAAFGSIQPAPLPGWQEVIQQTTESFLTLPPDADKGDIAVAAGPISEATSDSERVIRERFLDPNYQIAFEEIVKLSWVNFFQVLQAYFIVPFERILTQFDENALFIPIELKKALSEEHVSKDLVPIIAGELSIVKTKKDDIAKPAFSLARAKIKYFLDQMAAILPFKNNIRPIVVPGRDRALIYIQRAIVYGPLATLVNAAELPPGAAVASPIRAAGDPSMRFLSELVAITLTKHKKERLTYSDQEIKELIAIRNEKERVNVIAEFDKMTDEERAVELINKKLGIGKWAVGGTKLIYAYDKDYYDLERQKREAAGIIDFPGLGPGQMEEFDGRETDAYGFPVFGDEEMERQGGYDFDGLNEHADEAE
jgi:hypothetical protein